MTEDYKKNLLDYVTGNLQEGTPTTDEIIKEQIEVNRSKWTNYMPSSWSNMRIEGFIKPNSNTCDLGVMYGGYKDSSNNSYGFIILVDINMNPVQYLDSFSTGTKLRYIQCMIQGEDNFYYAIDDTEFSYNNTNIYNTEKRFLMLNNFSTSIDNDYKIVLRASYKLNGTNYQNFYCKEMFKQPDTSHFAFCGWYASDSTSAAHRIKAIDLKVNVGMANEWNYWQVNDNISSQANIVSFNSSGETKIQIVGIPYVGYDCYLYTKDYNSNSLSGSVFTTFTYQTATNGNIEQQGLFLDSNNFYFIVDTQDITGTQSGTPVSFQRHLALFHYDISTSTLETIYDNYMGTSTTAVNNERMQIESNEGKLYISLYNNFGTNLADYYIQRYDGEWSPIKVGTQKNYSNTQRALYIGNIYNLLQIVLYPTNLRNPTWYFFIAKEIYNQNQYNGESYVSKNSLCPLYANLYSNGSLMFSRNLYNISKQNNMTNSSVEIQNTYLNNITIEQNDLISETNLQMLNNNTSWNKNIYEVVDLNFLNTISVIDEDTNTSYLESAIKINNAVTDGGDTNYQNTPCNKYRINYADSTTKINSLYWNAIDDTHKNTIISLYVDKSISSIDFISNDETTIYLTLPLEVEIGKYYSINQKIRIGE